MYSEFMMYGQKNIKLSLLYRVQIYILKVSRTPPKKKRHSKVFRLRSENIIKKCDTRIIWQYFNRVHLAQGSF